MNTGRWQAGVPPTGFNEPRCRCRAPLGSVLTHPFHPSVTARAHTLNNTLPVCVCVFTATYSHSLL